MRKLQELLRLYLQNRALYKKLSLALGLQSGVNGMYPQCVHCRYYDPFNFEGIGGKCSLNGKFFFKKSPLTHFEGTCRGVFGTGAPLNSAIVRPNICLNEITDNGMKV